MYVWPETALTFLKNKQHRKPPLPHTRQQFPAQPSLDLPLGSPLGSSVLRTARASTASTNPKLQSLSVGQVVAVSKLVTFISLETGSRSEQGEANHSSQTAEPGVTTWTGLSVPEEKHSKHSVTVRLRLAFVCIRVVGFLG